MIDHADALARAIRLARAGDRVLIGITGSPGVGKTVVAERLVGDLNTAGVAAAHVPMDGFHLADVTLDRLGRRQRKGAIDTFDGWGYLALLQRLRSESDNPVYAPDFQRDLEEPVAGSIEVPPGTRVVVSEGNYLLFDEDPWGRVRDAFDETWFCVAPEELRVERLVARHMRFGRSREEAVAWARDVDGINAAAIERTRGAADVEVSTV